MFHLLSSINKTRDTCRVRWIIDRRFTASVIIIIIATIILFIQEYNFLFSQITFASENWFDNSTITTTFEW